MIYRTSQRGTYRNINQNLGLLSYRIGQLTSQLASEQRINRPSDDPSGAATVLRTRSIISDIYQYKENIGVSDLWLSDSGAAAQSIKETLDEIHGKLNEQSSTDTYSDEQRQIILDAVNILFESIIKDGNAQSGDHYIFGGQSFADQPFSRKMLAQQVRAGCQNSTQWNGKVQNYGDATFNPRSDLPTQSQNFLIEVVQAGGVDSQMYSHADGLSRLNLTGANGSVLNFTAAAQSCNNARVRLVTGPANTTTTGTAAQDNLVTYSGGPEGVKVVYRQGGEAQADNARATWSAADNTVYIDLKINADGNSIATAADIAAAANGVPPMVGGPAPNGFAAAGAGAGRVDYGQGISFNNLTRAEVNGREITVYLERDTDVNGGAVTATAADVAAAVAADPAAAAMVAVTGAGAGPVTPSVTFQELQPSQPYTLARATVDPTGTQNALVFAAKNGTNRVGAAGNALAVQYVYPAGTPPVTASNQTTAALAGDTLTVTLAMSASLYAREYDQLYYNPVSPYFNNVAAAQAEALKRSVVSTGKDVMSAANAVSGATGIGVTLAEGNSGLGRVTTMNLTQFSEGYDQPALFRVSQDGGKTWGPPQSFYASEFKTGDMFYNSMLGHASLTTGFPGQANDLVFTANHMGAWGNDVRVEYKTRQGATNPQPMEVCVGPNPYNICVYLETDNQGSVVTTANDVMNALNNHASASQWVTVGLANYHEGGGGVVGRMDMAALSVGEPFQINGKTQITPLGYATGAVSFPYKAPDQKDPNIIFQALQHGGDGNDIGIRYTTSADPTYMTSATAADQGFQDFTSVRYEEASGKTVVVVHLATTTLPSCPDDAENPGLTEQWKRDWPTYSCTSSMGVMTTCGDVLNAIMAKNMANPESAVVWASMERWPEGWESTAKVGPTSGTVWLTGGDDLQDASNHGVKLRFIPDGTALQTGDVFEAPVGWYAGDDKNIDINIKGEYRTAINTPGSELLGANGAEDNVLDAIQRLTWALKNNNTEMIGAELPKLRSAIEKVTTVETKLGTRMIRNQFVGKSLDESRYNAEDLLSQVEDVDFSTVITQLKNAQTVYEAVLGATGLTSKLSLLSYI